MVRRPPRLPSVALVLRPGSLDKVWLWYSRSLPIVPTDFRLRISPSPDPMSAGSSKEERVEELYTLILRLGSGSSRGEVVMGILWGLSLIPCCREKSGPRKAPTVAVKSGGAEGCRGWGLSVDTGEERSCSLITRNDRQGWECEKWHEWNGLMLLINICWKEQEKGYHDKCLKM